MTLSREDAVFEAVFLHELAQAQLAPNEAACITTRGASTDGTALLAALKSKFPAVIANKECEGGGPSGPVRVTATGGAAARFDIGPIEWNGDTRARIVSGGAHRGGMHVREVEFTLELQNGVWKIVGEKLKAET